MAKSTSSATARTMGPIAHPDYLYWLHLWQMIRDAEIGEVEVKRKGALYLPKLVGHDAAQYASYLHRGVFFNMTSKTLNALYGTVFKRNPKITGMPKSMIPKYRRFSKDGMSLHLTAKTATKEVLALGRYGMLVDAASDGVNGAYTACYTAENILDWSQEEINGEWKLTRVLLREVIAKRSDQFQPYKYESRFRVLVLWNDGENYTYEQHIYNSRPTKSIPDVSGIPDEIIVPTVRGEPLDYIPFIILGPFTNSPDIQKPPILDIVTLNFSHYESYAQLEQGRFHTAQPIYYVSNGIADDGAGEYFVGPDVVWELGKEGKAGLLEFTGSGLKYLESALSMKENQIASIGGRMMPGAAGAAESDNSLKLKEQNEQTLLLNIADTVDEGITQILRWWADWNNVSADIVETILFEVNRDFLIRDVGAREIRAIHQMYADGIIPIDVVYEYLLKAEVIPEWMDADEFKTLLSDAKQFPHMVDVLAQMNNYPNAQAFQDYKIHKDLLAQSQSELKASAADANAPPALRKPTAAPVQPKAKAAA